MKTKISLSSVVTAYLIGCVLQNILAVKTFALDSIPITTAGTLISWAVFACMDIVTEVKGAKYAVKTFSLGLLINIIWNLVCRIAILIPGDNSFVDGCYEVVLGTGWRITAASALAFWIGNCINTSIMSGMKRLNNKGGFCARAVLSTLAGQLTDNILFYVLAFAPVGIAGTIEKTWGCLLLIAAATTLIETLVEWLVSPATKKVASITESR